MEHSYVDKDERGGSRGIADRVKEEATAQFSSQKARATDTLGSLATAIRQSSQPLRDNNQEMLAEYAAKAADQIDRFSSQLRESDMHRLMSDAKQFAHQRPAIFVGAAFAVGVIAARFLKSSVDGAHRDQRYGDPRAARYSGGL